MEKREDLETILPFLPLILRSSSLFWPPNILEALKALSLGPEISLVDSGEVLFDAIFDLRDSLGLSGEKLASKASQGYALFFNQLMSRVDSRKWFGEVVPELARLLLRLPSLLEAHYRNVDQIFGERKAGLRILGPQDAGIVFLSQDLIAALLACSMFCLFPITDRSSKNLPTINFDHLFACLHLNGKQNQEQKIKCLIHYFERISSCMPVGFVSFERKVLPIGFSSHCVSYPEADFWKNSTLPLCSFEVSHLGLIEDQEHEALEVDFANKYLGGGALHGGCVQEEIRFMINPELIAGMLFLPSVGDNEAIEIVGAERYSKYMGYASSFRFMGEYLDKKPVDSVGRRRTRIVALDALYSPRMRQYEVECLVREANKAFCGFHDQSKYQCYQRTSCIKQIDGVISDFHDEAQNFLPVEDGTCTNPKSSTFTAPSDHDGAVNGGSARNSSCEHRHVPAPSESVANIGIATGNWGCGAFGGDPELKCIIQWLATSQAFRPFILYFTFGEEALQRLEQVTEWILSHGWTVGDLWSMLVEYACQRLSRETRIGFFDWLLPCPHLSRTTTDADYMTE